MRKKREKRKKWNRGFEMRFEESDLQWLAERFQKQLKKSPDLTLEEFASQHAVPPKWIRRFLPQDDRFDKWKRGSVMLWHATTEDRAKVILEQGFVSAKSVGNTTWFTARENFARGFAKNRARMRGKAPVIFHCEIDLNRYPNFHRYSAHVYVFDHPRIAKEVITDVLTAKEIDDSVSADEAEKQKRKNESIDIMITGTSGKLGVLWWMNSYLAIEGEAPVTEEHSAVDAIWGWVEAQYTNGRTDPISDEEMLIQVITHLEPEDGIGEEA